MFANFAAALAASQPAQKIGRDGLQHFNVTLSCAHAHPGHQIAALPNYDGKPYNPNYVGIDYGCRVCRKSGKVTAQEAV
jgi:hypothetical protein